LTALGTYSVRNAESNETRSVALVEGLSDKQLGSVTQEWTPKLIAAHDRAILDFHGLPPQERTPERWQEIEAKFGAPDWDWDWTEKHGASLTSGYEVYGLLDGASVEAMMVLNPSHKCRLKPSGESAIYVEYLAIAPWNRQPIQDPPRYKGLGKVMLGVAVSGSLERGMLGRCGLHALHSAEGFYARVGMTDVGLDKAAGNYRYFEFSAEGASKFLETTK